MPKTYSNKNLKASLNWFLNETKNLKLIKNSFTFTHKWIIENFLHKRTSKFCCMLHTFKLKFLKYNFCTYIRCKWINLKKKISSSKKNHLRSWIIFFREKNFNRRKIKGRVWVRVSIFINRENVNEYEWKMVV